jgi:hypothetical protein
MLQVCKQKCFEANNFDYLSKGENLCVDRCIAKFFKVAELLDERSKQKMEEGGTLM